MKVEIAPSILSADFSKLGAEIAEIEPYSDRIHVDVMDGHFVPNISFGAPVMQWIDSKLPLDVHLMIEHPWRYYEDFVKAGASIIIIHEEVCDDMRARLLEIKNLGVDAGICIKPDTEVEKIEDVLDIVDQVLVMTVEPGFGGQKFMPEMIPKVVQLREMGYKGDIGIDGGITDESANVCIEAGANLLIAGSYVFGAKDRRAKVESLRG
jgi:ribulose-phosphate 3-epimerase